MKKICVFILCVGILCGCASKNELEKLFADDDKWIPINQVNQTGAQKQ